MTYPSDLTWPAFIRPTLLPGELAVGFREVLATVNGFPSWLSMLRASREQYFRDPQVKPIELLAGQSSKTVDDLVVQHTLTPLVNAFSKKSYQSQRPHWYEYVGENRAFFHLARNHLYLCPCCAEEDPLRFGRSYWRRAHQAPGVDWCHEHWVMLLRYDKSLVNQPPHDVLRGMEVRGKSPQPPPTESIIRRYIDMVGYFFEQYLPIPLYCLRKAIRCAPQNSHQDSELLFEKFSDLDYSAQSAIECVRSSKTASYRASILALASSYDTVNAAIDALCREHEFIEK